MKNKQIATLEAKPHYALLDGLRGAAALMVVWYHVQEGFAFAAATSGEGDGLIKLFNHGYLAVDFFFVLSGFVIGYAYDDRFSVDAPFGTQTLQQGRLTTWTFLRRRLVRLHPMLVMGAVLGAVSFCLGGCAQWDGTAVPLSMVLLALLMNLLMIPAVPGCPYDVRGNGEMFSLNGPTWSLFFEYVGNILYVLLLRRMSRGVLTAWVAALGVAWAWYGVADVSGYGMVGVGWTLDAVNFCGGMLRMLFPMSMGLLLARSFRSVRMRGIFWFSAAVLFALFSVPFLTDGAVHWNGVFEMACIMVVFPLMVWLAASGRTTDKVSTAVCRFMGDISYPLYMVHYPVMYLFYGWLIREKCYTLNECPWMVVAMVAGSVLLAFICWRLYDVPVRRWLRQRSTKA